jgi:Stress responsive A/B Barrel Domain
LRWTPDARRSIFAAMFSHVVVFWTHPDRPNAAEELIAGAEKYLRPIPGLTHFHAGKMVKSHRDVVDQSYQVALNLQFANKQLQDEYQVHPLHLEFVEKAFKPNCQRAVIYDFE